MIVDVIIIILVLVSILIGKHNGMVVSLINIFSLIIALVLAFLLCKPVGNTIIENTNFDENLKTVISERIPMSDTEINVENTNLPEVMKTHIQDAANDVNETKNSAIDRTSTELSTEIIYVISFIAIFIVVKILLFILKIVSKLITKLPVLKQIDHAGGAVCGLVEGIIVVYAIFAVISVLSPVINNTVVMDQINSSNIGKQIYNNNILLNKLYKS